MNAKSSIKERKPFQIRRPQESDAQSIIDYSKILFASTDQVLTTLDEYTITLENEKTWINNFNQNPNAFVLVAECETQIIGLLFFVPQTKKKNSHTGEFGVSVHPSFQGMGIGRALIDKLQAWANASSAIEKIFLNVFASNRHAIKLYGDLGFKEEGRFIKAVKQPDGTYVDVIQMYIETNAH
jgi:RimJ/RimL family protein N-acetyltransferase